MTSLRCSATARSTSSVALGEQRFDGRVDDGVAEQGPLRFERGDGVVDRRHIRHQRKIIDAGDRLLDRVPPGRSVDP